MLKRFVPSLRKRYAQLCSPKKYRVIKRDRVFLIVNYSDWADRMAVVHGVIERSQIDYLFHEIDRRGCELFVDIGAHMGIYAIMAAMHTKCGRIVAFEPDPKNFAHLEANLLINDLLGRIEHRPVAVSNLDAMVPFAVAPEGQDVWSKIPEEQSTATAFVPAVTLDKEFPVKGMRIALKIDIELHERQALEGMRNLLRNNQCLMQVECFPWHIEAFSADMKALGYRHIRAIGNDHYFAPG
jgi:FkbM family methyltransferase